MVPPGPSLAGECCAVQLGELNKNDSTCETSWCSDCCFSGDHPCGHRDLSQWCSIGVAGRFTNDDIVLASSGSHVSAVLRSWGTSMKMTAFSTSSTAALAGTALMWPQAPTQTASGWSREGTPGTACQAQTRSWRPAETPSASASSRPLPR